MSRVAKPAVLQKDSLLAKLDLLCTAGPRSVAFYAHIPNKEGRRVKKLNNEGQTGKKRMGICQVVLEGRAGLGVLTVVDAMWRVHPLSSVQRSLFCFLSSCQVKKSSVSFEPAPNERIVRCGLFEVSVICEVNTT